MPALFQSIILGLLRNVAALAGGWLVAHGVANAADEQSFIGSVCFLGALGFTAYDKLVVHKKIGDALVTPVAAPPAPPAQVDHD
jgi:hypothetical protein